MDRKIKGRVSPPLFLPTMALRRAPLPSVASTSLKCLDNATESCAFKDVANSVTTRPTLLQQGSTNGEGEWRGMEERGGRLPRMSVNPARLIKARLATSWKRENALFTDSSLSLSLSKLSFCFPACHSRGRKFRERGRDSRCHEMDGKLSVRLCFERATVNRIFPSVSP